MYMVILENFSWNYLHNILYIKSILESEETEKGKDYHDPIDDPEWYDLKDKIEEEKYVKEVLSKLREKRHGISILSKI